MLPTDSSSCFTQKSSAFKFYTSWPPFNVAQVQPCFPRNCHNPVFLPKLRRHSWTHKGVSRMRLSRTWLKCLLLYCKMKVIRLPVSACERVYRRSGWNTSQGRRSKERTSRSILKSSKPTATVFVQDGSKEAEDEGRERGRSTEEISLNVGCDKKMRRRQNWTLKGWKRWNDAIKSNVKETK